MQARREMIRGSGTRQYQWIALILLCVARIHAETEHCSIVALVRQLSIVTHAM